MPITIAGSGTITGISAGGLPDASIVTADIADANITAAKLNGAQSGSAPIYGCRAWVSFDGTKDTTGATSTANTNRLIRASGNVTSVLRNGTGDYTVNFTTAMPDANYSAVVTTSDDNAASAYGFVKGVSGGANAPTASAVSFILLQSSSNAVVDRSIVSIAIFR